MTDDGGDGADPDGDAPEPTPATAAERTETATVRAVALRSRPADLLIEGGFVLLPDGALDRRAIAVAGDRIAALPAEAEDVVGPETTVVDADGGIAVPGFVDAHDHFDLEVTPGRAYRRHLARGTTTVVTETSAVGAAFGPEGVEAFLSATADLPLSVLVTLPTAGLVTTFERHGPDAPVVRERLRALSSLVDHPRVVGAGELGWIHFVGRPAPAYDALAGAVRAAGGRVAGHGAGVRGPKLEAFAATVDNDHEATVPSDVAERRRAGLWTVGRAGSIRNDLDALVDPQVAGEDRFALCTDGAWIRDRWGMVDAVEAAVDAGVDPQRAVGMATAGSAAAFGLEDRGRLAPGSRADVVVLDDLGSMDVRTVVAGGEVVVRGGDPVVDERPGDYPETFRTSGLDVHFAGADDAGDAGVAAADRAAGTCGDRGEPGEGGEAGTGPAPVAVDLSVPADAGDDGTVLAIERAGGMLTREAALDPPVVDGEFVAAPDRDLLKLVAVDRGTGRNRGKPSSFVGFVRGPGLDRGAIATTLAWEQPAALAVGADDRSLRRGLRRVARDGGWAVVDGPGGTGGEPGDGDDSDERADGDDPPDGDDGPPVLAAVPMGIGGVCADRPANEVVADYLDLDEALAALGATPDPGPPRAGTGDDPGAPLAIQTLTFTGVPALRVTPRGYADVLDRQLVGLDPRGLGD